MLGHQSRRWLLRKEGRRAPERGKEHNPNLHAGNFVMICGAIHRCKYVMASSKADEISRFPKDHILLVILTGAKNLGFIFDASFIKENRPEMFPSAQHDSNLMRFV
jgi:hypothetical protein